MVRTSPGGQFVHIRCGDGLLLRRPISVCLAQEDDPSDLLRIVFEARGEGTQWLAERNAGESLDVLGLLGNNFSMKEDGRYFIVGGGIGVPPMLGCAARGGKRTDALLGFRDKERVMLEEEFKSYCNEVHICTDDGSYREKAFADTVLRNILKQDSAYDGILACGPKVMLKAIAAVAAEFSIPCQVSMEERMGCGVGACLVCACDMKDGTRQHVCKDGPVFYAEEVDWDV